LEIISEIRSILDLHQEHFLTASCVETLYEMVRDLDKIYDVAARHGMLEKFRAACQSHRFHQMMLLDPYTERAFTKPRGYAGDATMLDFIYRPTRLELAGSAEAIHALTTRSTTAASILWRRDHLAAEVARTVNAVPGARILSVASGHLRELDIVRAMVEHRNFEIVALDQDQASLEEAVNSYGDFNIRPINRPITFLLKGDLAVNYDLIYAAGLFDYLQTKLASALLGRLLSLLSPSGKLILGNFAPENYGRGYMEGMMNWSLAYRNEAELEALAQPDIPSRVYRDDPGNVVYLEVLANHIPASPPMGDCAALPTRIARHDHTCSLSNEGIEAR
jgi:extracellular factor (EF) 3-hydroxypalmitic acid methyl ester biosynthesis protein